MCATPPSGLARPTKEGAMATHDTSKHNSGASPRSIGRPVFAQPEATADPAKFRVKHPSDNTAYKEIDELNREDKIQPLPFPPPRGLPEPRLTLEQVFGGNAAAISKDRKS